MTAQFIKKMAWSFVRLSTRYILHRILQIRWIVNYKNEHKEAYYVRMYFSSTRYRCTDHIYKPLHNVNLLICHPTPARIKHSEWLREAIIVQKSWIHWKDTHQQNNITSSIYYAKYLKRKMEYVWLNRVKTFIHILIKL